MLHTETYKHAYFFDPDFSTSIVIDARLAQLTFVPFYFPPYFFQNITVIFFRLEIDILRIPHLPSFNLYLKFVSFYFFR